MLRLLGGARGTRAPTWGGEGRRHIVSPCAQLVTIIESGPCITILRTSRGCQKIRWPLSRPFNNIT